MRFCPLCPPPPHAWRHLWMCSLTFLRSLWLWDWRSSQASWRTWRAWIEDWVSCWFWTQNSKSGKSVRRFGLRVLVLSSVLSQSKTSNWWSGKLGCFAQILFNYSFKIHPNFSEYIVSCRGVVQLRGLV